MRMSTLPRQLLRLRYARAAQEYLHSLPLEHFMEATAQGTQRKITLESFDLIRARRSDVHVFNELLLQYRLGRRLVIRQVVPDNTVMRYEGASEADTSYDVELQPVGPLLVMEYVSKGSQRKDYEESFRKYERELKVPYYLLFYPDNQDLTLFRLRKGRYASTRPSEQGRYPVPELDLEVALLDGWVRFWYQGKLLPLPAELQGELDEARRQLAAEKRRADEEARRADRLRQEIDQERQARLAAEQELAQLRVRLARRPKNGRS
jgi:Uma2 family endonuclease